MVKLKTVEAKNFMTKTGLGHDFTCNPFVGCEHGCFYCYAQTMPLFSNRLEPWGTYVDIKTFPNYNIPRNTGEKSLIFSSMTDAYQPTEASVRNTRTILENIYESNLQISILTKSDLVTRDLDLFKKMKSVEIGFSIATNDEWAKILEPRASLPSKRIEALKQLHQSGIRTYVFISPVIPFVTDVLSIIDKIKDDVDYIMIDKLNLSNDHNKLRVYRIINHFLPEKFNQFQAIFDNGNKNYYEKLKLSILKVLDQKNIDCHYLY